MANNSMSFDVTVIMSPSKLIELFDTPEVKNAYGAFKVRGYAEKMDKFFFSSQARENTKEWRMLYLVSEALRSAVFYNTANYDLKEALCLLFNSTEFRDKIDNDSTLIKADIKVDYEDNSDEPKEFKITIKQTISSDELETLFEKPMVKKGYTWLKTFGYTDVIPKAFMSPDVAEKVSEQEIKLYLICEALKSSGFYTTSNYDLKEALAFLVNSWNFRSELLSFKRAIKRYKDPNSSQGDLLY